jgi:hypothetical protein
MRGVMLSEDFDKVTVTEFFGVLAAIDESEPETMATLDRDTEE